MSRESIPAPPFEAAVPMPPVSSARFAIGDVVRHRMFDFRGVIFDVDPVFANSDEWYEAIPEDVRPRKDQPFYHLLAENAESSYIAYVSQQNLVVDETDEPVDHPAIAGLFERYAGGRYKLKPLHRH
ncbi:heat shock protein HspQ [Sphingomonas sp. 7/4-4]|uniref:heat shock protein HspQ n=1 Tax=Sphingomonas sp. 7/4-4 TaxID=3018446 RepID=UPI0022F3E848|nr:heat shock protein HspQ [Sphingomonas sp. 7/4-4]WBY08121.1 heat shock protein HspQ [Sphingomonas sp. 7/4-4]